MLTHGNMASNIACSMEAFGFGTKEEVSVSFLPLSHVTARHVDFALLYRGVTLGLLLLTSARLAQVLTEVQPNIFIAVPRVYEKIRQQVILKSAGFPKNAIYHWALSVGRAHRAETLAGISPGRSLGKSRIGSSSPKCAPAWAASRRIHLRRRAAGPRTRRVVCRYRHTDPRGLRPDRDFAGYRGEYAPHPQARHRRQTAGQRRSADCQRRRGLVRGPSIFKGYWNRPDETAAASSTAGSKPATSATRRRWISFHHRSQKRSDQNFRRKIHRAAAHRELAEAEARSSAPPWCWATAANFLRS